MFFHQSRHDRIRLLAFAALIGSAVLAGGPVRAELTAQLVTRASTGTDEASDVNVPVQMTGTVPASRHGSPRFHILPANTEAGWHAALTGSLSGPSEVASAPAVLLARPLASLPKPGFFPDDLTNFFGGTIASGSSEDIYYDCPGNDESCWGDPEGFISNLAISKFIHVVDQYVGLKSKNRYPLSSTFVHETDNITNLTSDDVENFVHEAAVLAGSGHIFHLFLPQGFDVCSSPGQCYSPDNPSTFTLCAYHSFANFNDFGMVPYTVEPFQDIPGCRVAPPNPNSAMIDSTNSSLSHELFELITDPFLDAWVAENTSVEAGNEIADICHGPGDGNGQVIVPEYVLTRGHVAQTQLEYSNARHGCVVAP
jgi:hypothetical protein